MIPTIPNHVIRDALAEDEPAALSRTTLPAAARVRIGECDNLWARYRGGTAYTLDAAGHGAGNLYFVADAPEDRKERCRLEATLIYALKPRYNNQHMKRPPLRRIRIFFCRRCSARLACGLTKR